MAFSSNGPYHRSTVTGRRGMIASAHPLASLAGLRILMQGGNAIDAAIATAAALNVTEPYMSGMGGDGYMQIYHAKSGDHKVLDYMGRSPLAAELALYADPNVQTRGPKSPLVPGACGGWFEALERYGTMDAATVFAPAIEYAEQGFAATVKNTEFTSSVRDALLPYPSSVEAYLINGAAPQPGQVIVQPDLANTFRSLAEGGADLFYTGEIAEKIVRYMAENGGLITAADLAAFRPDWQDPISTTYRGNRIYTPAPPCQGISLPDRKLVLNGSRLFNVILSGSARLDT